MKINKWIRICLLTTLILFAAFPVNQNLFAQGKELESRLFYEASDIYINSKTIIDIVYKDRIKGEELTIHNSNDSVLKVKEGKWYEDKKTIILQPKKSGSSTITITTNDQEQLTITVHTQKRQEMTPQEIYETTNKAMVEILTFDANESMSMGSGFFINSNQILTNYHVIEYANRMIVRDYDGATYEVTHIYDYNTSYDLAILGVKEASKEALILNKNEVETGMDVYALGSPLELSGTISEGIVSKAYRQYEGKTYHQSTAYISQSSGGGPLLNSYGEVIGINTLRILGGQNIYLAVDIDYVKLLDRYHPKPIKNLYTENQGKIKIQEIYITIP